MTKSTPTPQTDNDGTIRWLFKGEYHRADGPAVEYAYGSKYWYVNGTRHRVDGPAVECPDGDQEWWVDGQQLSSPYTHILTAAFNRGLPIPPEVFPEVLKGGAQAAQLNRLNSILNQYWPTHVKKILATLFSHPAPAIKHIAFSLLGQTTAAGEDPAPRVPLV